MNYEEKLDALKYYMEYFINNRVSKEFFKMWPEIISFEQFCSEDNIIVNDIGEGWNNRGKIKGIHGFDFNMDYASKSWVTYKIASLQHYKSVGLKL